MSRGWIIATTAVAACLLGAGGCGDERQPASDGAPQPVPTPKRGGAIRVEYEVLPSVLLEAEDGDVKAPMEVFEGEDASGGEYVLAPEGPDHEEISIGGDATYRFHAPEEGAYSLWVRARFSGACGNSLGVMLNGRDFGALEDAVFEKWHWVPLRARRPELAAGQNVLVISNREDGAAFDQVLLTQDSQLRPVGVEEADVPGRTTGAAPGPEAEPEAEEGQAAE